MTSPGRYLVRMGLFLAAVAAAVGALFPALHEAFLSNPALNGLILGVLIVGIGLNIRQAALIGPEVKWLKDIQAGKVPLSSDKAPHLLAPMASMLGERVEKGRFVLSPLAMRSLLDGIASRLEEARDISRYFVGLSIFLGLLGTFWGLLETVASIGEVIKNLSVSGEDATRIFTELKAGLQAPMDGMGTAFSSSLFGLAGSLVLGFMELQASQAQNKFFNDLEEWLSGQTRISSGTMGLEGSETPIPAYIQALLEQTADSLSELQHALVKGEQNRAASDVHLRTLGENLTTLTDQMRTEIQVLGKIAESQSDLRPMMASLSDGSMGFDGASRTHLRNMDAALTRLVEDTASGREQMIQDLRSEFKLLARTMAAFAQDKDRG